jgi:long-chain acyl-CoA synthetase
MIEFCREKIAGYKIPKHVIFIDEIPKTNIYKTSYKEIRELAKREVLGSA